MLCGTSIQKPMIQYTYINLFVKFARLGSMYK